MKIVGQISFKLACSKQGGEIQMIKERMMGIKKQKY